MRESTPVNSECLQHCEKSCSKNSTFFVRTHRNQQNCQTRGVPWLWDQPKNMNLELGGRSLQGPQERHPEAEKGQRIYEPVDED